MRETNSMKRLDRRTFLKLAGGGSVVAAAAAVGGSALLLPKTSRYPPSRASTGLPAKPMAAMATKIVEGTVDLTAGTGIVTTRVLAGYPVPSQIALPGLTRLIRVTAATQEGALVQLTGVVDDRSQLQPGESPAFQITIDRVRGLVTARPAGQTVTLIRDRQPG